MPSTAAQVVNQQEFRIIGMSRSGNHAIINWIMAQASGRLCFLNCTEPQSNPFLTARPLETGLPFVVTFEDFALDQERRGRFSRKDYLIYSHEDTFLGRVTKGVFEEQHDALVGASAHRVDILILRDPFNLFASRRKFASHQGTTRTAVRLWKQHAREFLSQRRYLHHHRVVIPYNAWVRDRQYRRQLAAQLGLPFTDAGVQQVAQCGGGSSFDGLRWHNRAWAMPVLDRWKHFVEDETYLSLFDPEILHLAHTIFGPLPGTENVWPPCLSVNVARGLPPPKAYL